MSNDKDRTCSFCGAKDIRLLGTDTVAICEDCCSKMGSLFEEDKKPSLLSERKIQPYQIVTAADKHIIGQDRAKKTIATALSNHFKRYYLSQSDRGNLWSCHLDKQNLLLIGPTGCGKTALVEAILEEYGIVYATANAASMTADGYVGTDINQCCIDLIQAAQGDVKKAEWGVIYIDEIDKIASKSEGNRSITRDVSGESVQHGLLKLIEGTVTHFHFHNMPRFDDFPRQFDTSNILFICSGAFSGLDEIIEQRLGKKRIGFQTEQSGNLTDQITPDDLIEYGFLKEFVGRFTAIETIDELGVDQLKHIITQPKHALLKQTRKLLSDEGITLDISNEALEVIADRAYAMGTGARALKTIWHQVFNDIMYETTFSNYPGEVCIDQKYVVDVLEGKKPDLRRVLQYSMTEEQIPF